MSNGNAGARRMAAQPSQESVAARSSAKFHEVQRSSVSNVSIHSLFIEFNVGLTLLIHSSILVTLL